MNGIGKAPRFFCDNCDTEVARGAKSCPKCGRYFAAVRCPACGLIGEENTFAAGCPACGYSAPLVPAARPIEKKVPAGPLPLWVYILSICAFICVMAILIYVVSR